MTQLHEKRFVACPFSATIELAEKAANRHSDLYVSPYPPLGERVHFAIESTDDSTDEARKHDALLIAWRPENPRIFPDFRGVLTVRPKGSGVELQLDGAYVPPFGGLGNAFDLIVGRSVARRTMQRLLADLGADIEAEYQRERGRVEA
ncbi:MAG TPA: hypothetical protein VIO32_00375 [Candidatus Baltobacteraceae bacterium]